MIICQILEVIILNANHQILIFLTDVAVVAIRAAHLSDGPSRVPAITALPKAVSAVKPEKTICLIIRDVYPTHRP